ncbi:MAG: hypothetical protein N3I35_01210 [Clostridia bacterium]|nr:hypothetical protein [Clostridia bacterium]
MIDIRKDDNSSALELISELESMENDVCNISIIFAEMLKDEINANDEEQLFSDIKKIINKYSDDMNALSLLNEFTEAVTGGATMLEILQITRDEAKSPSAATDITVSKDCNIH